MTQIPAGPTIISRRTMLHALSAGGAGLAVAGPSSARAMQPAPTANQPALTALNRFPRMVQEFQIEFPVLRTTESP